MELNVEFFNHLFILLGLMVGFTAFKISNCKPFKEDGEDFDLRKLWLGTARNLIVIAGTTVVFLISCKCGSELFLIQMGETQVTLQSAIDLTTLVVLGVYGTKYIKNLAQFAGVGEKMPEIKEVLPAVVDKNISTDEAAEEIKG